MMDFKLFKSSRLPTASDAELKEELEARRVEGTPFPLHVFPQRLKPFIESIVCIQDCPREFVGGTMMAVLSVAIGSYYIIYPKKGWRIPFTMWLANVGITSSGKSMAEGIVCAPLYGIQQEMEIDNERADAEHENMEEPSKDRPRKKELVIQNTTFESLTREMMPDNPKGMIKHEEELTSWLDNMKAYTKTDMERKFWLTAWNLKPFMANRSQGKRFRIDRPFCSVVGGTQPGFVDRFFTQELVKEGFTARMLFNVPEKHKVANANLRVDIPQEHLDAWNETVCDIYNDLSVSFKDVPKGIAATQPALDAFIEWTAKMNEYINDIQDDAAVSRDLVAGAYGKMKEYVWKFAGILAILEAHEGRKMAGGALGGDHKTVEKIEEHHVRAGIELGNYYMNSFSRAYLLSSAKLFVPVDVLDLARLFKSGASLRDMSKKFMIPLTSMKRKLEKNMREYPHAFGANVK